MPLKHVRRWILGMDVPVLGLEETLAFLEASGASLARWGDGETAILRGRSIPFQDWSPSLSERLGNLLNQRQPGILLAIPAGALKGPIWRHLKKPTWLATRVVLASALQPGRIYADAFMFRDEPVRALAALKASIGRSGRVVVVSSNPRDRDYFSGISCPVVHVLISERNAFAKFESICRRIRSSAAMKRDDDTSAPTVVLFSAGPAAKALVAELAGEFRCYDVGHLFHFQRNPAKKNVWAE